MFKDKPPHGEQDVINDLVFSIVKEQKTKRRWGIFFKLLFIAYIVFITATFFVNKKESLVSVPHTAEIDVSGVIAAGTETSADHVIQGLQNAFKNSQVKGVILRINSPGGSPVQSEEIYNEVRRLEKKHPEKKVYAVCEDACASGAYYIASAAHEIYAQPASLIGSIGVIMNGFGFTEAMKKLGVESRVLTAGKNKGFLDPFSPMSEEQKEFALTMLKSVHEVFIADVKQGRGNRLKNNPEIFSGLVWTGLQARKLGLVDHFGGYRQVAAQVIKAPQIVDYTVKPGLWGELSQRVSTIFNHALHTMAANIHLS
ncbi:signal peptide peptidase SppA [Piscirickettsia salmonis]|uniref:signal peptide peptidase SppA n=1 Tax=Piscirickettsia salmonis TaxID=1238 RepID=UPI0007C8A12E|nr:putative signal peptide peptidase SppA [Piscirickettsiaceae bacterium NZ-RLO1]